MRKDFGPIPGVFPMPVLMVAAYDEAGVPCVMNAAWGTICDMDKIALIISESHKTTKNIRLTGAFTVSLADRAHMKEADYVGIVSGNDVPDKFERAGLHAKKSPRVNAPIIEEFPVTLECELADIVKTEYLEAVVGRIVNVSADERVLNENGGVDVRKLDALIFDPFLSGYYTAGEKAGQAWDAGKALTDDETPAGGYVITDDCIGCESCMGVCPQDCISNDSVPLAIDQTRCLRCGSCADACPVEAIKEC